VIRPALLESHPSFASNLTFSLTRHDSAPGALLSPSLQQQGFLGNMLQGLSSSAKFENSRVGNLRFSEQQGPGGGAAKRRWNVLRASARLMGAAPAEGPVDQQTLEREMDSVSESITQLRRRHDTFQPMSPKEAARLRLFGGPQAGEAPEQAAGGGAAAAPRFPLGLSKEAQLERFELLKYVRKIEPDLPPLERPPPPSGPPPNQALVEFNASPQALQRWRPLAHKQLIASRSARHVAHCREVAKQGSDLKAAALARKRESGELRATGRDRGALLSLPDAACQWLMVCAVASFTQFLGMDLQLRRMPPHERDAYIDEHWQQLRLMKLPPSSMMGQMVSLVEMLHSPAFLERVPLLSCFFAAKIGIRRRRVQVRHITSCLKAWHMAGPLILRLKRIGEHVRLLQSWWRRCSLRLRKIRNEVSRRWLQLEHDALTAELRDLVCWSWGHDTGAFQARIAKARFPDNARLTFIEHEMRARRYLLLPRIYMWEEDSRRWEEETRGWKDKLAEHGVFCHGDPVNEEGVEGPTFNWPPTQPSYMPSDSDILEMWRRARINPEGWLRPTWEQAGSQRQGRRSRLLQSGLSSATSSRPPSQQRHAPRSGSGPGQRAARRKAEEEEEEEYLRRLGISAAQLPGGLVRPPPPTAECDDD